MKYVNKNTGDIIESDVYVQLGHAAQENYVSIKGETKTHQIIETRSDNMSVGDGIAAVVVVPLAIISSFFD